VSKDQVQPHPIFAERLAAIAERLEAAGEALLGAELYDLAASLTGRGDSYRERAEALRHSVASGEDRAREQKRHNLEASHAVGMARLLEARGELGRAQEMFDLAKIRAPFHYLAYAGAGYLHLRRRDLRAALEEFAQARRLNPLDRKLAIEAARIALELEDYPDALRHAVDAALLSQGIGESEETASRRRVETLAALCRMGKDVLSDLHRQRAASLQRACEQVALTRARLFSALAGGEPRGRRAVPRQPHEELLGIANELRRYRVVRHFTDSQLVELAGIAHPEPFRHAQVLAREEQDDRDLFVVTSGKLQICRSTPMGTQTLGTIGVGELVGEVSYVDRKPRSSTIIGVDSGSVLRLPWQDLDLLVAANRELAAALLWSFWHALAAKVRAANTAMVELFTPGVAGPRRTTASRPGQQVFLDPAAKLDLLREQGLSSAELRLLATYSREERFPPEALIFGEGEQGDKLFIIVEGQVRISRELQGMGEEALTILGRGEVFGEMALIDDGPRSADARAHTQGCTVFIVDRQRLEEVLEMDPDAARQFLTLLCQLLCRRLRAMNDRLVAWRLMAGHQ
jgi:CRP/FNR family transcriptional regulator, cyclic AMP receptor protein